MIALVLMAFPAVSADAALPVGNAHGVKAHAEGGEVVVVFTKPAAQLYRRIAGKWMTISCTTLENDDSLPVPMVGGGGDSMTSYRAPKQRRPLRTGDRLRRIDYCRVWRDGRTVRRKSGTKRYPRQHVVSVPLTQAGAIHLDEQSKSLTLWRVLLLAGYKPQRTGSNDYPLPAELPEALAKGPGWEPKTVALPSPADTPPPGVVGYFSDGQQHAAVVVVSASGRRLFVERQPDGVLSTNVAAYLYALIYGHFE